jgi:lauroyl/myristoyl acyltransferase
MLEMNQLFEHAIKESIPLYGWEYKKFRKLRGKQKNIY